MSVDLTTKFLGFDLRSPFVASSSPLTGKAESLRRLADAGVAAVVLPSLFEEQVEHDAAQWNELGEQQSESFAESLSFFPELDNFNTGPDEYLKSVEVAKECVDVPVIASLNGSGLSGWVRFAEQIANAGADAIELNIFRIVTDPDETAAEVEQGFVDLMRSVCDAVSIPVAAKIGAQFSALPHFARRMEEAGAKGLVLFNRFLYPEMDLHDLEFTPHLRLSTSAESLKTLRWIAILRDQLQLSLGATSGVHHVQDAIKVLLAGADVVMLTSALLKQGPEHIVTLSTELQAWLEEHEYQSLRQMQGSMSLKNCPDASAIERANYMHALLSYSSAWM